MVSKLKIQASRNFGQPPLFVRHSSQETQQPGQFALQIMARDKIVKAKGAKGIKTKCVVGGNGVKAKVARQGQQRSRGSRGNKKFVVMKVAMKVAKKGAKANRSGKRKAAGFNNARHNEIVG